VSNAPFVTAPLISRSGFQRSQPAPLLPTAQRPLVLARAPHIAQQLTLFGPGGRR
jgi:hypothetical protein